MLVQNKSEKNDIIPLLEIIQKKYGLKNIFFIIISILCMGVFSTLIQQINKDEKNLEFKIYTVSILFFFIVFIIGFVPFIKVIVKNIFLVTWLSFEQILIQLVKVIIFSVVLICMIQLFQCFYLEYLDPFK